MVVLSLATQSSPLCHGDAGNITTAQLWWSPYLLLCLVQQLPLLPPGLTATGSKIRLCQNLEPSQPGVWKPEFGPTLTFKDYTDVGLHSNGNSRFISTVYFKLHLGQCYNVSKVIDFPRYNMKCSGGNVTLRGIINVLSRFPVHFMFYRGNLNYCSNNVGVREY